MVVSTYLSIIVLNANVINSSIKRHRVDAAAYLLSHVRLCVPMDCSPQAPLSMGFPGKNTGAGCHFLFQGIFPTQGLTPGLLRCRQILYH